MHTVCRAALPLLTLFAGAPAWSQVAVSTAQYDNLRTGANLRETVLAPRNVNPAKFGKLFALPVDGDVYAQPLYIPNLQIPGKGVHDVVLVATELNSVFAFDAKSAGEPLWHRSFIDPSAGIMTLGTHDVQCSFIAPDIGITATPVVDLPGRAIYFVVRTSERGPDGRPRFFQRLRALDISTGEERPGSPVLIRAYTAGASSWFGLFQRDVTFHSVLENPRAAMLLANGTVYIAWGSSCDVGPYYGWVLAYDAHTLRQTGVFNAAPDASESGIWQSDAGIAADPSGVYAVTGNGKFTAASGGRDYGDSVIRLAFQNGRLAVNDYFTPSDQAGMNRSDDDLGANGPVLLPDQPGPHPHLLVAAGKSGMVYLIDRDHMGQYQVGSNPHALQVFKGSEGTLYGAPAWWNGHLYLFGGDDVLKDFPLVNGRFPPAPAHRGPVKFKNPGAIPVVSANGPEDGIVWTVLTKDFREREASAVLQAYDAADVSRLLYTTAGDEHNTPGRALRFTMPTVANGRVYVGSRNAVWVYGLLDSAKPTTATSPPPKAPRRR